MVVLKEKAIEGRRIKNESGCVEGGGIEGKRMKGTIDTNVSLYWGIERGEERVVVLKEKAIEGRKMKRKSGC